MLWLDKIFGWLSFGSPDDSGSDGVPELQGSTCTINPASGLPMAGLPTVGGCGGVDVAGNPYGTDLHDSWLHASDWDSPSSFSSNWDRGIGSSWDD